MIIGEETMRGQIPNEYDYVHEQSATVPFLDDVNASRKKVVA